MSRRSLCVATLIFFGSAFADDARDSPSNQLLYPLEGDNSRSVIYANCDYPTGKGFVDCDIQQVYFTKPEVPEPTDDGINELVKWFDEMCNQMGPLDQLSWDDPEVQDRLTNLSPADADKAKLFLQNRRSEWNFNLTGIWKKTWKIYRLSVTYVPKRTVRVTRRVGSAINFTLIA